MSGILQDIAAAFQFLTRLPLSRLAYKPDALPRAVKYFPLVGLAVGAAAAALYRLLSAHLPITVIALLIVLFTTLITGGMHEDGLADAADAFGGGWNRQQVLEIMKDSRIGSFGALALMFSIGGRVLLVSYLPAGNFVSYVISAEVLCRWVMLPLAAVLPGARPQGSQGARIARQVSGISVAVGTLMALGIVGFVLRLSAVWPVVAASAVALFSGLYYKNRIGGITGDCFGASSQVTLLAIYLCGVWRA
jgi:adenosylcobinamide-GDP ribazoletransferase